MDDNQRGRIGLLCLFERPFEPLNAPRANGMIQFQQTLDEVEAEDNQTEPMEKSSDTRFGDGAMVMNIPKMDQMDQLEKVKKVPKGVPYSHFDPVHAEAAHELTQFFMDSRYVDKPNYWQYCGSIKEIVNEGIFIFALSCAIIRNPAIDSRLVPAIYEVFPNMFIKQNTMVKAMDMAKETIAKPDEPKIEHVNDNATFSGFYTIPEHRVAYWREDYGMNAHHWHWHLVFPSYESRDRKGEIFYYMHNQMLGRYDWERLSNGLERVDPLRNWHDPIPEGYFPNLTYRNASMHWGNRPDNMTLHKADIAKLETWRQRFSDAIVKGYMLHEENETHIDISDTEATGEDRGINILGNALEPNRDSINRPYYGGSGDGGLHGMGHSYISRIHDPEGNHTAAPGVMGFTETAMRDPVFYRWHKFIDDIFQQYKMTQKPYEEKELLFDSVLLESVSVNCEELDDNVLETGWTYCTIEVSRGLDFFRNVPISVRSQHLTNKTFTYKLQVTNNEAEDVEVTVRLYMAPKFDAKGETMTFMDQRLLWAEMDRYYCKLEPGLNSLERLSTESSITIHENQTFRNIENRNETSTEKDYCGCGWPQHLLLPKGTVDGMEFQIFALISDWKEDKVEDSCEKTCSKSNAASYCGILGTKYPDKRPMGYPFDRKPDSSINGENIKNATDFATALPNACMTDVKIIFKEDGDLFPECEC